VISQALVSGWRRTLPAALAPVLSDIPVVAIVLLVLTQVPALFVSVLQVVGGLFVLVLAGRALLSLRVSAQLTPAPVTEAHRTVLRAAAVNLLNPNPYIAWALILGPLVLRAWQEAAAHGLAFVGAFYTTIVGMTGVIIVVFATMRNLGPRVTLCLLGLSATALAGFGLYQIWSGVSALLIR
jgi:threonine/homoserine/homoserine lactone efflux protein